MKCEQCGKEHDGTYGSGRFCCKHCRDVYSGNKFKEKQANKPYEPVWETRICERCGTSFTVDLKKEDKRSPKRFCSRKCANTRKHSEQTKNKIRTATLNHLKCQGILPHKEYPTKPCVICGKLFQPKRSSVQTCSPECRAKLAYQTLKAKGNIKHLSGGYREHSGRGKSGWYKGIFCQSTYELAWVIYNLDNDIAFERCKQTFEYIYEGKTHTYHPDFVLADGTIVEIKGYHQPSVTVKQQAVLQAGYKYQLLYKNDLKICFDYIYKKYGVAKDNLIVLFDESKGYYTKTCEVCGKEFKTKNKDQRACSRVCNGKIRYGNQGGKHFYNPQTKEKCMLNDPQEYLPLLEQGWLRGDPPQV